MNITNIFPYSHYTDAGLMALAPFILLGIGATVALILSPFKNGRTFAMTTSLITILFSAGLIFFQTPEDQLVGGVLILGGKSSFIMLALHIAAVFALFLLGSDSKEDSLLPESYPLTVYALCGMSLLVSSHHLLFQFVALEVMSLAIYVLVAMRRAHRSSAEAGMKYFILGGLASATFLYGSALIYGATGSFILSDIATSGASLLKTAGFALVVAGLLFKVGAVPFHGWLPDVYEGAAIPVTGFMAAAVKFAAFIVLAKVAAAGYGDPTTSFTLNFILSLVACLTMVWGNFAALTQSGIKRLLAYSSIAHTGYLIIGVVATRTEASTAIPLYLVFYTFSTLGAFACLQTLAPGSEDIPIEHLAGRGLSHPFTGAGLTLFLFAMAGIPMTAGFIGKYLVFGSGVQAGYVWLVVLGVLTSVAAVSYYLRIIVVLYMKPANPSAPAPIWQLGTAVVILICMITTIYYGVNPSNIISYFEKL